MWKKSFSLAPLQLEGSKRSEGALGESFEWIIRNSSCLWKTVNEFVSLSIVAVLGRPKRSSLKMLLVERARHSSLTGTPANRSFSLIEFLFKTKKSRTQHAYEHLQMNYKHHLWSLWSSKILVIHAKREMQRAASEMTKPQGSTGFVGTPTAIGEHLDQIHWCIQFSPERLCTTLLLYEICKLINS